MEDLGALNQSSAQSVFLIKKDEVVPSSVTHSWNLWGFCFAYTWSTCWIEGISALL